MKAHDPVNHPSHYNSHPSGIEAIVITRHHNFNIGNVIKYLWRQGLKEDVPSLQDLKKAAWYLNDEIKRLEGGAVVLTEVYKDPPDEPGFNLSDRELQR